MERSELESTAARVTYLRGLLAVPAGLLFIGTAIGNLTHGPAGNPFVALAYVGALAGSYLVLNRYYNDHYGRVRLSQEQQVRLGVASLVLFGGPMIAGTMLDFRLDLPVSTFSVLFGLGMLAWCAICVGLRPHHLVIWGGLVVIGLLPVWGGFDDRASVGWIPIGVATIVAGIFDHLALVRTYGPADDVHVAV